MKVEGERRERGRQAGRRLGADELFCIFAPVGPGKEHPLSSMSQTCRCPLSAYFEMLIRQESLNEVNKFL